MNNEIILISKLRYLQHGSKAPANSRFKGTVTLESLTGLVNYHSREDAKTEKQNLLNYSSKIAEHQTLTHLGYIDSEDKEKIFKKEISKYFNEDGRICWDTIVSLPSYEVAHNYGLYTPEDYTYFIEKGLTKFFVKSGLELNNMIYWIDHHNDTDNPHCHVGFMEKNPTIKSGFFSEKKMDQLKKMLTVQLLKRKSLIGENKMNYIHLLKEKDQQKIEIRDIAKEIVKEREGKIGDAIKSLYNKLADKGRLSYNSIHIKEHREELDNIVRMILESNDDIRLQYNHFRDTLLQLDNTVNQKINSTRATMLEAEEDKLKIQIANYILKEFKDYSDLHPNPARNITLDFIPTLITNSEDLVQPITYPDTNIKIYFNDTDIVDNSEKLKTLRIKNNKTYMYIDEDGIGKRAIGNELFKNIQTQLYTQAQKLNIHNHPIIHNSQITPLSNNKMKIELHQENIKFQVNKNDVKQINHLFSIVEIKDYSLLVYSNGFKYMNKDIIDNRIFKNTNKKIEIVEVNPKYKKQLPKGTAMKIARKGRSLGMGWMNKIENETQNAINEFLNSHGK